MAQYYYYKEKTPAGLNQVLLSIPYFKEHWKCIPAVVRLLNRINRYNQESSGASSINWTIFRSYFRDDYIQVRKELESLGLLHNDYTYRSKMTYNVKDKGKCYSYMVPPSAQALLADVNKEYLYTVLHDPKERRKKSNRVCKRVRSRKAYNDVRDDLTALNDGIRFNWSDVQPVIDRYPQGKRAYVYSLLLQIEEKDYSTLQHNEKDNRVWTPYAQLPPEIKALITVNALPYITTIDIRSCYPSLWAEYITSVFTGQGQQEREKYNSIFLNKDVDPKVYLSSLLGIERSEIKEVLIQFYNGKRVPKIASNPFNKFSKWLSSEFPTLFNLWKQTDIKQTGNNIGKYFETRLMLDRSIYEKAKQLGLVIGYEYDGLSFYGNDPDVVSLLLDFIKQQSVALLGIELVFKFKNNHQSLLEFMASGEIEMLNDEVEENDKKLARMRGMCWYSKQWDAYRHLKAKNINLIRRIVELSNTQA